MLPVIGVTASVSDDRLSFQQKRMYCEAISACGGLPLILPPQEDVSRASQVLSLLDGLLLAGGDDIDPHYYGEEALPECGLITPIRDTWEMPLCREALHRHLPLLGICRGLQVLNVALGGSLVQDLPSQRPDSPICHQQTQPPEVATHPVRVDAQSRFARIFVSGVRADDMALRLKYAGFPAERIELVRDYEKLLGEIAADAAPAFIMPTYTAMFDLRGEIGRHTDVKAFYE